MLSISVNPVTNRITTSGYSYDSNGNLTAAPSLTMSYDVENRMAEAVHSVNGTDRHVYDPSNQRVWKQQDPGSNLVYFYGVEGTLLATYGDDSDTDYNVYFAGRQVWAEATPSWGGGLPARPVSPDRLGSMVRHFPYGQEASSVWQDRTKFATYYRDRISTLDYARNRYYSSTIARFTTPDPYQASGGPADPQSWNRYAYVQNDPVIFNDPLGLMLGAVLDSGVTFSTTVYAFPISGDLPPYVLAALLQRGNPRNTDIAMTVYDIWEDMFDVAANALGAYAGALAGRLRGGDISEDCTKDIVALGITPDDWADKLDNSSLQNGIRSRVPYAEALPIGSAERALAQQRNLTIGSNFGQGSPTTAVSSANDNRVWIDPRKVNFGDPSGASGFIAHEALHKFSGLIDTTIQEKLGLPVGAASVNISERLARDCFPGPSSIVLP